MKLGDRYSPILLELRYKAVQPAETMNVLPGFQPGMPS